VTFANSVSPQRFSPQWIILIICGGLVAPVSYDVEYYCLWITGAAPLCMLAVIEILFRPGLTAECVNTLKQLNYISSCNARACFLVNAWFNFWHYHTKLSPFWTPVYYLILLPPSPSQGKRCPRFACFLIKIYSKYIKNVDIKLASLKSIFQYKSNDTHFTQYN
jgi:hypothetical protein